MRSLSAPIPAGRLAERERIGPGHAWPDVPAVAVPVAPGQRGDR
jgi:hypothetical protein